MMKNLPSLLRYGEDGLLPDALFADLQIRSLLDEPTVSVLRKPCGRDQIPLRQEVFRLLEEPRILEKVQALFSCLKREERLFDLLRECEVSVERYFLSAKLLCSYREAWEMFTSMGNCGTLFRDAAQAFAKREETVNRMNADAERMTDLLDKMKVGLLSFSDKNWITPDCGSVAEYDGIADCVRSLGLSVSGVRSKNTRVDTALSDSLCRLYGDEIAEAEGMICQYDEGLFREQIAYLSEIRFFLNVHALSEKAKGDGIPHCFPKISAVPRYTAKELYDVSLLTKECRTIVPNDADFTEKEPFCFLVGANGGGKTTYLRAVGLNLVLFLGGCPVFAREAAIYPFSFAASHFPADERFERTGRLDEERMRVNNILESSEGKTAFLLFNETYSGTDEARGFDLLLETAGKIGECGAFGLYVTHFLWVTDTEYPVLSAEIDASEENRRTYRVVKAKGAASSYAADILKKYGLDRESLRKRREKHDHSTAETV